MVYIYCALTLAVIGFQVALVLGAPWGKMTQGGKVDGPLPPSGRIAAALSVVVLLGLAAAILSSAWEWPNLPVWTGWLAVAINAVTMVLNWITPSVAERRLWGPITSVMFVLAFAIVWT